MRPTHCLSAAVLVVLLVFGFCADARRVVAVGDLHGDYNQSRAVLRLTGLIDDENQWIGEDAYLVQLGDVLDVGPDDIEITEMLMDLEKQSRAKGGNVVQLLGNHELRNFRGDYRAVEPEALSRHGGKEGRDRLLSNETEVGRYLRTRNAVYHYGPFLFMHGGFSTATVSMITNLDRVEEFNSELRKALLNGTISPLAQGGLNLDEEDVDNVANPILVRSILNVKCKDLDRVLTKHFAGIQSVVVGHVPHDPRDFDDWRLCNGRLIDVDFGLSRWKKGDPGHVAALEIDDMSWHTQLIETRLYYDPPSTLSQLATAHKYRYLRISVFIILLSAAIGIISYLLRRAERRRLREEQPRLLDEDKDAAGYGTAEGTV